MLERRAHPGVRSVDRIYRQIPVERIYRQIPVENIPADSGRENIPAESIARHRPDAGMQSARMLSRVHPEICSGRDELREVYAQRERYAQRYSERYSERDGPKIVTCNLKLDEIAGRYEISMKLSWDHHRDMRFACFAVRFACLRICFVD